MDLSRRAPEQFLPSVAKTTSSLSASFNFANGGGELSYLNIPPGLAIQKRLMGWQTTRSKAPVNDFMHVDEGWLATFLFFAMNKGRGREVGV
jgi:hypothetical protein